MDFQLFGSKKDREDLAFMNEVDAAYAYRGSPWAYVLSILLLVFFLFFFVWSCRAQRNEVTQGAGQIIPSLGVQPIQSEDGGILKEILVTENELVEKNTLLATISNIRILHEYEDLHNKKIEYEFGLKRLDVQEELLSVQKEIARLHDEIAEVEKALAASNQDFLEGQEPMAPPESLPDKEELNDKLSALQVELKYFSEKPHDLVFTEEQKETYPKTVEDQLQLFHTTLIQWDGEDKELAAVLAQRALEIAEVNERRKQYEDSLYLLKQQERRVAPLVPKRFSEVEYLNLKQRIITLEGELKRLAADISKAASAMEEADERLKGRVHEREAAVLKEQSGFRQELDSIVSRLVASQDLVQRQELRTLVKGTVKRILLKEGAVVKPAELIMEILPADDALEIEARFKPAHRGFLKLGQNATVKISAYDSAVYGTLDATVIFISPDTIEDNKGEPWYQVRLRTNSTALPHAGKNLDIKPGMTVTVDVLSGKKSVFNYLVKPLFKSKQSGRAVGTDEMKPEERAKKTTTGGSAGKE